MAGGIGAAFGGFADGFSKGLKTRSELEDAEQRRGLMSLQAQQAQLQLDSEKQFQALNKQIGDEINSFAALPDKDDPAQFDAHYTRLGGLLKQQAILAKKDPLEVDKSIQAMRKDRFAERVYQGAKMLELGDVEGGLAMITPAFNRSFKDGNQLVGGTYDKATDTINLSFIRKDGTSGTMPVKREDLATKIAPLALNTADAVKLDMAAREKDKDRAFEGGQNELTRGLKRELTDKTLASEEKRTSISAAATRYTADKSAEVKTTAKGEAAYERNYDDFVKQLPQAFGFDKNDKLAPPEKEATFNRLSAEASGIWKATAASGGNLTASEIRQVMEGVKAGRATTITEKDGYRLVQVGSIRAVVPVSK